MTTQKSNTHLDGCLKICAFTTVGSHLIYVDPSNKPKKEVSLSFPLSLFLPPKISCTVFTFSLNGSTS